MISRYILWLILLETIFVNSSWGARKTEPQDVFIKGRYKFILESLQTNCDHDYVTYFHKVPDSRILYTFRVAKTAPAFTIDIHVRVLKTQRVLYKIENLNGCQFLNNPVMHKVFGTIYRQLVVNGTFFSCPIKPQVYFLKNEGSYAMLPGFHPAGRYQLTMRVKMTKQNDPQMVMEMLWIYNIVHMK
ncbi:uncharacterized protein LOC6646214 [Drosophila willistoni]|uniref:uncharacterized protein LOC6646214 n=1 Tax=Drosophila willistoni TaxID=7260 RepID=UPI000C26D65D|nr:uncharacterized protein LOC6646214 [Drosophila willistoni]